MADVVLKVSQVSLTVEIQVTNPSAMPPENQVSFYSAEVARLLGCSDEFTVTAISGECHREYGVSIYETAER